jgi:hypothetical protein
MNHSTLPQTSWEFDEDKDGLVVKALVDIPISTEIFYNYGDMSNSKMLLNYGFVSETNKINDVSIELELTKDNKLYELKKLSLGTQAEKQTFWIKPDL